MAENIKTSVEELRKLISIENVVGKPIDAGDQFLIPVMRMGVGFGACENILGNDGNDTVGAGAGVEPVSMVIIPKNAKSGEGVKVVNLTKGTETNKALSDLGLIVSDLVKNYFSKSSDDYDESEYIEPEFTTTEKGYFEHHIHPRNDFTYNHPNSYYFFIYGS